MWLGRNGMWLGPLAKFCSEKVAYVEPNPSFFPYARENSRLQPLPLKMMLWRTRLDERRVSRSNNKGEKSQEEKPSTEAPSQNLFSMTNSKMPFALKLAFCRSDQQNLGRSPGKRVGPNHGWSSTRILATFCFLLLLPIRMTLLLPNLFHSIIKISLTGILFTVHVLKYFEQDLPIELLGWIRYIFIPLIAALLGGFIGFIYELFLVPLYFWNLLWHPNGRSIYSMLCNPEGNGRFISRIDNSSHRRYREQACPVPRWVW